MLTYEQQKMRATGIGASEIAAIAGIPGAYGHPLEVWGAKMHHLDATIPPPPALGAWYVDLGNVLEEPLAHAWAAKTGLSYAPSPGTLRHPSIPYVLATPDRMVGDDGVLEIKKRRSADGWGEDGDAIAPAVLAQVQWQLAVCERTVGHVAVLIGGVELRTYVVAADPAYQADLLAIAAEWWTRHIVGRTPPPIDGTDAARRFLAARYPLDTAGPVLDPDVTRRAEPLAEAYARASAAEKAAAAAKQGAANALRELLGEHAQVEGAWGRVSCKAQRAAAPWRELALGAGVTEAEGRARAPTHRVLRVSVKGGVES